MSDALTCMAKDKIVKLVMRRVEIDIHDPIDHQGTFFFLVEKIYIHY